MDFFPHQLIHYRLYIPPEATGETEALVRRVSGQNKALHMIRTRRTVCVLGLGNANTLHADLKAGADGMGLVLLLNDGYKNFSWVANEKRTRI